MTTKLVAWWLGFHCVILQIIVAYQSSKWRHGIWYIMIDEWRSQELCVITGDPEGNGKWICSAILHLVPISESRRPPMIIYSACQEIWTYFALPCVLMGLDIDQLHWYCSELCNHSSIWYVILDILKPMQNGCHFVDDILNCIFVNKKVWISINISLKFVHRGEINNIPALDQIMAWRRPGDKPLSEPMMFDLLTHICITRPQWVKGMGK